jgi:thiol-disulfide isomerase/thioredoxin
MGVTAGAIVVVAVLALATVGGFAWRWRDGRLKGARQQMLTVADLGQPLGARATLLQFSSSSCAPCRAARQLLADVAARSDGVTHLEINVADRLDLVRRLDIRRTPTVFVLGPQGQISRRASGLPRRDDVVAAVAAATGEPAAQIGSDSGHGLA